MCRECWSGLRKMDLEKSFRTAKKIRCFRSWRSASIQLYSFPIKKKWPQVTCSILAGKRKAKTVMDCSSLTELSWSNEPIHSFTPLFCAWLHNLLLLHKFTTVICPFVFYFKPAECRVAIIIIIVICVLRSRFVVDIFMQCFLYAKIQDQASLMDLLFSLIWACLRRLFYVVSQDKKEDEQNRSGKAYRLCAAVQYRFILFRSQLLLVLVADAIVMVIFHHTNLVRVCLVSTHWPNFTFVYLSYYVGRIYYYWMGQYSLIKSHLTLLR